MPSKPYPVARQRLRIPPEYAEQLKTAGRVDSGSLSFILDPAPVLDLPSIVVNPVEHNKLPLFLPSSKTPHDLPCTSLCTSVAMTGHTVNYLPDLGYSIIIHVAEIVSRERHVTRYLADVGQQSHVDIEHHFRCTSRLYFEDEAYALVFMETVGKECKIRPSSGALLHILTFMLQECAEEQAKKDYKAERA